MTTDGPLKVHPALAKSETASEATTLALEFLRKYLSSARLTGMSMMGLGDGPEPWIFVAFFALAMDN